MVCLFGVACFLWVWKDALFLSTAEYNISVSLGVYFENALFYPLAKILQCQVQKFAWQCHT